jgi:predicted nucleotidyltransferase
MNISLDQIASRYPSLQLVLLFGSRARGDAQASSDWDFGYIANSHFDPLAFYSELVLQLGTENVDLVDLQRANGLLRFRAAQDGKVIFEKTDGVYEKFWLQAVHFWCDAGPLLRREYDALLEGLG